MSEKFLAPSKTPDNGHAECGADKSDRSPWSFSSDSLLFQTPRPAGGTSAWAKVLRAFSSCNLKKTHHRQKITVNI
jgi:hypothetical protein